MKLCSIFLIAGASLLFEETSAQNLVPNSSFEEFDSPCTSGWSYYQMLDWTRPDCASESQILSACGNTVPSSEFGYQDAHSGISFAVIWTLRMNSSGGFPDGNPQFYPSVNLTEPLVAGQTYCLRLRINLADSSNYRTGALHAFLWYGVPSTCNYNDTMWDTYAAVTFDISQVDTAAWTTLEGSFTASGSESNLTLGAFQYGEEIDSVLIAHDFDQIGDLAVYFLDDVELWACEVGIGEANVTPGLVTFPNPTMDVLNVEVPGTGPYTLQLHDALGRPVLNELLGGRSFQGGRQQVDVGGLAAGRYVVQVQAAGGQTWRTGFVVVH